MKVKTTYTIFEGMKWVRSVDWVGACKRGGRTNEHVDQQLYRAKMSETEALGTPSCFLRNSEIARLRWSLARYLIKPVPLHRRDPQGGILLEKLSLTLEGI